MKSLPKPPAAENPPSLTGPSVSLLLQGSREEQLAGADHDSSEQLRVSWKGMPIAPSASKELLHAALGGLEYQVGELDRRIAEIKTELGTARVSSPRTGEDKPLRKRRPLSAATKKRMAAAQRKRWAQAKHAAPAPQRAKRKMSAAGRKRIIEATKKRWAAWRATRAK